MCAYKKGALNNPSLRYILAVTQMDRPRGRGKFTGNMALDCTRLYYRLALSPRSPNFSMMHVPFSVCIIEKVGVAWGRGYWYATPD